MSDETSYKFGPSGGPLSDEHAYDTSEQHQGFDVVRISQVDVWSQDRIDKIVIQWLTTGGGTVVSNEIPPGGGGGDLNPSWEPNEPVTAIKGTFGTGDNAPTLRVYSLQFFTENGNSDVYGKPTDSEFFFQCPPGYQIIDLFGWADTELDSLGVYIDLIQT